MDPIIPRLSPVRLRFCTGRVCHESICPYQVSDRQCGENPGYDICVEPLSGCGRYIVILSQSKGDSMAFFRKNAAPAEDDEINLGTYAHLHERDQKYFGKPDDAGNARKPHRSTQAV